MKLKAFYLGLCVVACGLGGELSARLDDWMHLGTPFAVSPDRERDLLIRDALGLRGKPGGKFKKWKLNQFGFRGAEVTLSRVPGCRRVMVLGASEAFGLHESEGREFPAQLASVLQEGGCYEVINAAIPGISLRSMIRYWEGWLSQFQPDLVALYPSPLFYLDDLPPERGTKSNGDGTKSNGDGAPEAPGDGGRRSGFRSRFLSRFQDLYHSLPPAVKRWREEWVIRSALAGKNSHWVYDSVPRHCLQRMESDLRTLVQAIRKGGAVPLLVTHAVRSQSPPRTEDREDLHQMRMFFPRATSEVMVEYEREATRTFSRFAGENQIPLIDLAALMSGRREWFADLVHFNNEGAGVAARYIGSAIRRWEVREVRETVSELRMDCVVQ